MENNNNKTVLIVVIIAVAVLAWYLSGRPEEGKPLDAEAYLFVCDNSRSVVALYQEGDDGEVELRLSHSPSASLAQSVSASGAKYASADEDLTFWNKGEEATVTENGRITYSGCKMLKFSEE